MLDSLYARYAELAAQKSAIEEQMEKCRAEIVADMQLHNLSQLKTEQGTFSMTMRKTWVYSEAVDALKKQIDDRKTLEEHDGIALCEEKPSLAFRSSK